LVAAWHQVLGLTGVHLQDLVGLVVGGATSWLEGRLTVSVTEHLLTLCSGAGSIVAVIQSIYNAVTFFINNHDAIAALADRVLGLVSTIATGKAADLAHLGGEVEATMASTLPLLIDFLARQFGLGDVGQKLSELIGEVQRPIVEIEGKLVGFIASKVHQFGSGKGTAHGPAGVPTGGKVEPGDFPRTTVETDEGRHTIYVEMQGDRPVLMMASTPAPLIAFFNAAKRDENIPEEHKAHIPEGMRLVGELNTLVERIATERLQGKDATGLQKQVAPKEDRVAEIIKEMLQTSKNDVTQFDHRYELEGLVATYENMPAQKRDRMTPDHQPQSQLLKDVAELKPFANLFIQTVVGSADEQSPGGYCINLHYYRHKAGRTFSGKSNGRFGSLTQSRTTLADKIEQAGPDPVKQRTAALNVLKEALAADAQAMRAVAQSNDPGIWKDIHDLQTITVAGKTRLIEKIRQQILDGEDRMQGQDIDRLAR